MIRETLSALSLVVGLAVPATAPMAQENVGSGALRLGPVARQAVRDYLNREGPAYMFFSQDGRHWGASWCEWGMQYCTDNGLSKAQAQCETEADGAPCHLFAVEGRIVWQDFDRGQLAQK